MEKDDLETYQAQLSQVELSLASDPNNEQLALLKSELQELIDLTKAALAQQQQAAAATASSSSKSNKASGAHQANAKTFVWRRDTLC